MTPATCLLGLSLFITVSGCAAVDRAMTRAGAGTNAAPPPADAAAKRESTGVEPARTQAPVPAADASPAKSLPATPAAPATVATPAPAAPATPATAAGGVKTPPAPAAQPSPPKPAATAAVKVAASTTTVVPKLAPTASPASGPASASAGSSAVSPPPARTENASAGSAKAPAASPAPALNLASLEQRLKDTNAIGVMTKITIKNQVDELLERFKAHHEGRDSTPIAQLRQPYDTLIRNVLALLQEKDPSLASSIAASREAIWGVLTDRTRFSSL